MTLGTAITLLIIAAAVVLIVFRMLRARRAGRSVACEECAQSREGGCPACAQADELMARVNDDLATKQNPS